ncbi:MULTISPECIES: hypothetical protein [Actinomycetes]|nr:MULTISPECIES: hypothetical protein [Actinomycetes]EFL12535.1 predicted protein [Streptomyces sp. AA4]
MPTAIEAVNPEQTADLSSAAGSARFEHHPANADQPGEFRLRERPSRRSR